MISDSGGAGYTDRAIFVSHFLSTAKVSAQIGQVLRILQQRRRIAASYPWQQQYGNIILMLAFSYTFKYLILLQ